MIQKSVLADPKSRVSNLDTVVTKAHLVIIVYTKYKIKTYP